MKRIVMLALLVVAAGCRQEPALPPVAGPSRVHRVDVLRWRAERAARLKSENGWLTLVGLQWLAEGENRIETPSDGGTVTLKKGVVTLAANPKLTVAGSLSRRR